MREYPVSELTGNEILAKPVCKENGSVILEIGTALKVSYKGITDFPEYPENIRRRSF